MIRARPHEEGMILINVLLIVALAASVVVLMVSARDAGIDRALLMREAASAQAAARGGEASAITALRRDMIDAPEADHPKEAWSAIIETDAPIAGGTFSLAVIDAQAKFNVNMLATGDPAAQILLSRILAAFGYPPDFAPLIPALIRTTGRLDSLQQLALGGIDQPTIAHVAAIGDALPVDSQINLNTASEQLLALLMDDPIKAKLLVQRRAAGGFLTSADFTGANAAIPPGTGFTSNLFYVVTKVRIGRTTQVLTSLLQRRLGAEQRPEVVVIGRWWGSAPAG